MHIRKAERADLPRVIELWEALMDFHQALDPRYSRVDDATERWLDYIGPKIDGEDYRMFIAEEGGRVAGYVVAIVQDHPPVYQSTRYGFIETIVVDEGFRQAGLGRRLVGTAEEWLSSRGVPEITVRIDERNTASKALFAGAGFEPWVEHRRKKLHG